MAGIRFVKTGPLTCLNIPASIIAGIAAQDDPIVGDKTMSIDNIYHSIKSRVSMIHEEITSLSSFLRR